MMLRMKMMYSMIWVDGNRTIALLEKGREKRGRINHVI